MLARNIQLQAWMGIQIAAIFAAAAFMMSGMNGGRS
jgi:hypothetical protein